MQIPDGYQDLFSDDVRGFLVLATSNGDDTVAVAPVWFIRDDKGLVFTSEDASIKARNVRRQPAVAATVMAEGDHLRNVSVRGTVEELSEEVDDTVALYARLVRRYQQAPLLDPAPEGIRYFRLVPTRMIGYDFRDYQA